MTNRSVLLLAILAGAAYAWAYWNSPLPSPPHFRVDHVPRPQHRAAPIMTRDFVAVAPIGAMAHAASIAELADGTLAAVWYSGSKEGGSDVRIFFASRRPGENESWSTPRPLVTRESASRELNRFIKTLGNPLIFVDTRNRLWLMFVTVTVGGWSGASLNVKTSSDGGVSWTPSRRLTLSPCLNVSELVRNNPVPLVDGGFAIPIYHEFLGRFPELLWLWTDTGRVRWRKSRMLGGRSFIQPAVVPFDARSALALYRNTSSTGAVGVSVTDDVGATWSPARFLELPNPDAAVDALLLSDGNILLAFNDSNVDRHDLSLAVSGDRGASWTRIATLENKPGHHFSYPYLLRGRDGLIHLVYTWRLQRIAHITLNESWIDSRRVDSLP